MIDNNKIKKYCLDNPALVLTMLFIFSSATGILYDFIYYNKFHLNILSYSKAEDYLLSWLRDGNMVLNTFFLFLFFYVTYKTHKLVNTDKYLNQSRVRIKKKQIYSQVCFICIMCLVIIHGIFIAKLYQYSFYITIILFIISKIFDIRIFIFKSKLEGKVVYLSIENTIKYFLIIWVVIWKRSIYKFNSIPMKDCNEF